MLRLTKNSHMVILLVAAITALWLIYLLLAGTANKENKLINMVELGRHCRYVVVADKPIYCQAGELIFVSSKVASKYCDGRYIEKVGDSALCIYNGHNSVVRDNSVKGRRYAIKKAFRDR